MSGLAKIPVSWVVAGIVNFKDPLTLGKCVFLTDPIQPLTNITHVIFLKKKKENIFYL